MKDAQIERNRRIVEDFRKNRGDVKLEDFGTRLILVHHFGVKSGDEYVTPLVALREDADTWLIAASAGGAPRHPSWYPNLIAEPETIIETPEGVVAVRAEDLKGSSRDVAWDKFTSAEFNVEHENFAGYQRRTTRTIPVVALRRSRDA